MRASRPPETAEDRRQREEREALERKAGDLAEAKALDEAVRKSIKLYGP